jgi:hypothetical protein
MGFEPTTSSLARKHSTAELLPRSEDSIALMDFFGKGENWFFAEKSGGFDGFLIKCLSIGEGAYVNAEDKFTRGI